MTAPIPAVLACFRPNLFLFLQIFLADIAFLNSTYRPILLFQATHDRPCFLTFSLSSIPIVSLKLPVSELLFLPLL